MALQQISLLVVLLSAFYSADGQIIQYGNCPNYVTQPNFNPARFISGRWYQVSRYPSVFEAQSKCSVIEIKPSSQGFMTVAFKGVSSVDQSNLASTGKAYFDYGQVSKIIIEMPTPVWNTTLSLHFWVMGTDYSNYAVVWSCDPLECPGYRREQLWVLSRTGTLSEASWNTINQQFFLKGWFRSDYLSQIEQTNCPKLAVLKNVNSQDDLFFLRP